MEKKIEPKNIIVLIAFLPTLAICFLLLSQIKNLFLWLFLIILTASTSSLAFKGLLKANFWVGLAVFYKIILLWIMQLAAYCCFYLVRWVVDN